jgi:CPA1 family monovalent cation:H+ antiporter
MELFNIMAILITLSALFGYLNYRFIKLPTIIGLMLISMLMSIFLVVLGNLGLGVEKYWMPVVQSIDFNKTLMVGMLSFLLFAGALQVDIGELLRQKWEVIVYATVGVFISTALVGALSYCILGWLGLKMQLIYCLLFGALISPTDPIAVLGMLRNAAAPKSLEVQIAGESLFNDGIGVVLFAVLLEMATGHHTTYIPDAISLFATETIGGAIFGLVIGWIAYRILKSIDNYQIEILVTLSLVTGGYALASAINISGPIAIVVAGLLIGNHGRKFAMSEVTRNNLAMFWELIDVILNSVLFVLMGLELLILQLSLTYVLAAVAAIFIVLLSRFVSIGTPMRLLAFRKKFSLSTLIIMTWGGLRGGIAVALALSLPVGYERNIIIAITYGVVVFSVLVQGLTFKSLINPNLILIQNKGGQNVH